MVDFAPKFGCFSKFWALFLRCGLLVFVLWGEGNGAVFPLSGIGSARHWQIISFGMSNFVPKIGLLCSKITIFVKLLKYII